jgi:hypothetical protein
MSPRTAAGRRVRSDETAHGAVLHPAVAEAAHRVGASCIGLIDVGCSAGLNLNVDRVGVTYDNGQSLGDPTSPVQQTASIVGERRLPTWAIPDVVARVGIGRDPIDVTDEGDVRWLRACVPPDQPERLALLDAELAVAATAPPLLLRGDPVDALPDAFACVPPEALPVVLTTWTLSGLATDRRLDFVRRLGDEATRRTVAWVSVEGVGVAPGVPTLGDRPASGHSIIGLSILDGSTPRVEAIGRCYSRGRWLAWLADA